VGLIANAVALNPVGENEVLNWLLVLSEVISVFTGLTISLCHVRFPSAWKFHLE
jgi:amino acid permease